MLVEQVEALTKRQEQLSNLLAYYIVYRKDEAGLMKYLNGEEVKIVRQKKARKNIKRK